MPHKAVPIPLSRTPHRHARWLALILGMTLPMRVLADGAAAPPEFRRVPPLGTVREAAKESGFQLEGFAAARAGKLRPGDAATVLVTWSLGERRRQWIIGLEADEPTGEEAKQAEDSVSYHTSTGHRFTFGGGNAALKLRVAGPLEAAGAGSGKPAPQVEHRRILISPDYLALGLDRMPALMLGLKAAAKTKPAAAEWELNFSPTPYSPEAIASARRRLAPAGDGGLRFDKADEMGFVGAFIAIQEFFLVADSTPGIQEVLRSVVDVPWWSVISRGGRADVHFTALPAVRELEAAPWGLAAADPVYALPFRLDINGKPALVFQLAVTRPRPPLSVCAGVVGFAAGAVNGRGPVLTFQIVSTRSRPPGK